MWQVIVIKWLNIGKPENTLSHEGWSTYIIVQNMQVTFDSIFEILWHTCWGTERTTAAMKCHVIAAL